MNEDFKELLELFDNDVLLFSLFLCQKTNRKKIYKVFKDLRNDKIAEYQKDITKLLASKCEEIQEFKVNIWLAQEYFCIKKEFSY